LLRLLLLLLWLKDASRREECFMGKKLATTTGDATTDGSSILSIDSPSSFIVEYREKNYGSFLEFPNLNLKLFKDAGSERTVVGFRERYLPHPSDALLKFSQ
jgi:hypothetical protein